MGADKRSLIPAASRGENISNLALGLELVVSPDVLEEMIPPTKAILSAMLFAEAARILWHAISKGIKVSIEHIESGEFLAAHTRKRAMLSLVGMLLELCFVPELCLTFYAGKRMRRFGSAVVVKMRSAFMSFAFVKRDECLIAAGNLAAKSPVKSLSDMRPQFEFTRKVFTTFFARMLRRQRQSLGMKSIRLSGWCRKRFKLLGQRACHSFQAGLIRIHNHPRVA